MVEGTIIRFVGSNSEATALAKPYARMVNLKGRTVLPGMHDVHNHIMEASNAAGGTCMLKSNTRCKSHKRITKQLMCFQ